MLPELNKEHLNDLPDGESVFKTTVVKIPTAATVSIVSTIQSSGDAKDLKVKWYCGIPETNFLVDVSEEERNEILNVKKEVKITSTIFKLSGKLLWLEKRTDVPVINTSGKPFMMVLRQGFCDMMFSQPDIGAKYRHCGSCIHKKGCHYPTLPMSIDFDCEDTITFSIQGDESVAEIIMSGFKYLTDEGMKLSVFKYVCH